jgi:Uma2 family endonuclease
MKTVVMSAERADALIAERRRRDIGHLDECWEGVWHLTDPTRRHQQIATRICRILSEVIEDTGRGSASISINVTDREYDWIENHRCPDGTVILTGNPGRWIGENEAAFLGGPDLIVEVRSPGDKTYEKLPFYNSLGVKEVLIVDQETGRPEIWRGGKLRAERPGEPLRSEVTGLEFSQGPDGTLLVKDAASGHAWKV